MRNVEQMKKKDLLEENLAIDDEARRYERCLIRAVRRPAAHSTPLLHCRPEKSKRRSIDVDRERERCTCTRVHRFLIFDLCIIASLGREGQRVGGSLELRFQLWERT